MFADHSGPSNARPILALAHTNSIAARISFPSFARVSMRLFKLNFHKSIGTDRTQTCYFQYADVQDSYIDWFWQIFMYILFQVKAANWALERGTSVIICNGTSNSPVITDLIKGKKVGTFFTEAKPTGVPADVQAQRARDGGRLLQALTAQQVILQR